MHTLGHDLEGHIHRITRGAGDGADNHPFRLGEGIDDGRLAHVGTANDGELQRTCGTGQALGRSIARLRLRLRFHFRCGCGLGKVVRRIAGVVVLRTRIRQVAGGLVHQHLDAAAMDGRDGKDLLEPELGELGDAGL